MSELESKCKSLKRGNDDVLDAREREILAIRSELNVLKAAYDEIISEKSSLEFEVRTYRRLLESEEAHLKQSSLSTIKQTSSTSTDYNKRTSEQTSLRPQRAQIQSIPDTEMNQNERRAKMNFQKSAKGPINIDECSVDGKYIQLANASRDKDIDLTGWRLLRKVDDSPEIAYSLPAGFKLASRKSVKIHARGQGKARPPYDLVLPTNDSWGIGVRVITRLLNEYNEEKAIHAQTTVFD